MVSSSRWWLQETRSESDRNENSVTRNREKSDSVKVFLSFSLFFSLFFSLLPPAPTFRKRFGGRPRANGLTTTMAVGSYIFRRNNTKLFGFLSFFLFLSLVPRLFRPRREKEKEKKKRHRSMLYSFGSPVCVIFSSRCFFLGGRRERL